eukprot:sb/3478687/
MSRNKPTEVEWTESELDKFIVGSRDYLSEHFVIFPLKIDLPITEIFLLCWENSYLISIEVDMSMHRSRAMQQEFSQHNKRISVMGESILSGKNAKCSES